MEARDAAATDRTVRLVLGKRTLPESAGRAMRVAEKSLFRNELRPEPGRVPLSGLAVVKRTNAVTITTFAIVTCQA